MNKILQRAKELREFIERLAQSVTDEEAIKYPEAFERWSGDGVKYKKDQRIRYRLELYRVLQDHTSQPDWTPGAADSLYTKIDDPAIEWPEWRQPTGAHDAYAKGAKVTHNDKHWTSDIDANTYEPGVYGWTLAE